jgi:hypothetical protein
VNATFQFKDQLQAGWDGAKQYLSQGLELLGASIAAGFYKEHNQDDTHSTIHATGKIYEQGRTTAIGEWKTVPYNPNYIWHVRRRHNRYSNEPHRFF